ncbi:MAG: BCAM0308 family protein [Pseudomonadota bacterium]
MSRKKQGSMDQKQGRQDKLIQQERHDTYEELGKWPEPTVCSECNVVFLNGRWAWVEPGGNGNVIVCPACQRIKDSFPAGYVEIKGTFFDVHREEMLNLVSNLEALEKGEHPMERLMAITTEEDHTLITTTGIHLARRIGEAFKHAYEGDLSFTYGDGEKSIRLTWIRE